MHFFRALLFAVLCCCAPSAFSQTEPRPVADSVKKSTPSKRDKQSSKKEAEKVETVVKDSARLAIERMPGEALRRSAIIPGWGQIRNKRWWKVPIIYGGFVSLGLAIEFNQRYYKQILSELQYRDAHGDTRLDEELDHLDNIALIDIKDFYRRNRDLSVLATAGLYAINIIDAYVDAKFFRYDISDELSLRVKPALIPSPVNAFTSPVPAIKIQLKL